MDRNGPLRQALAEEALDLALLWQTEDQGPGLGLCPLAWIAHPDLDIRALLVSGEPLPLVMFDSPCLMRSRAIACLDAAGITWQVVFVSHSLSGIWAAVQAGLGLTIRTRIGMPGNLRPAGGLLPAPGSLAVSLRQTPREDHSAAVALLGELMTEALQGMARQVTLSRHFPFILTLSLKGEGTVRQHLLPHSTFCLPCKRSPAQRRSRNVPLQCPVAAVTGNGHQAVHPRLRNRPGKRSIYRPAMVAGNGSVKAVTD